MRGVHYYNIDAKGRLNLPAKFRKELGETFIVSKGLNQCLWVMSEEEFEALEDKISQLPVAAAQQLQYYFAANYEVEADAQGRVLVPPELRDFAGFDREIALIGFKNRVEIWDAASWKNASSLPSDKALELLGETRLF